MKAPQNIHVVKTANIAKRDDNDLITEVFKSKAVVVGSPTMGNNVLHSVAGFVHFMKELKFKNKKAAAFGWYGWSGESVKVLNEMLKGAELQVVHDGYRAMWTPDDAAQQAAVAYGKELAGLL